MDGLTIGEMYMKEMADKYQHDVKLSNALSQYI